MSVSPFQGHMSYDEYRIQQEMQRQESFEKRIIEKLFRLHNAAAWYAGLRKRVNESSVENQLTFGWFNERAGYPVKFKAVRFNAKLDLWSRIRAWWMAGEITVSPELEALEDLREAYPDQKIALILHYADFGRDLVVSNIVSFRMQQGTIFDGFSTLTLSVKGRETLAFEWLDHFLPRCAEIFEWRPAEAVD